MISCNIIEDLLILYVAKECSEDTKKMVEDHLSTCRSCQNILETLQSPVVPMERVNHELNNKEISFQKGFKKIRHRWIASSILLLLIIPLTGVGFLSRNEIRGEGI